MTPTGSRTTPAGASTRCASSSRSARSQPSATTPPTPTPAPWSPAETYILAADKWQVELLADLDRVPATGALVVATWPKPREGSGFPARVFAIVEREETRPTGD